MTGAESKNFPGRAKKRASKKRPGVRESVDRWSIAWSPHRPMGTAQRRNQRGKFDRIQILKLLLDYIKELYF